MTEKLPLTEHERKWDADASTGTCRVCGQPPSFDCREHFVARIVELEALLTIREEQMASRYWDRVAAENERLHKREAVLRKIIETDLTFEAAPVGFKPQFSSESERQQEWDRNRIIEAFDNLKA